MKTLNFLKILIASYLLSGCVQDQDELTELEFMPPSDKINQVSSNKTPSFIEFNNVLKSKCLNCHSPGLSAGYANFEFNSEEDALNSPYIVKSHPLESPLFTRMKGSGSNNDENMPPIGTLSTSDIQIIKSWIESKGDNTPKLKEIYSTLKVLDSNFEILEGGSSKYVYLQLSEPAPTDLQISFSLSGNALQGMDYSLNKNYFIIKQGELFTSIQVSPLDDGHYENEESMSISLNIFQSNDLLVTPQGLNRITFFIPENDEEIMQPEQPPVVITPPQEEPEVPMPPPIVVNPPMEEPKGNLSPAEPPIFVDSSNEAAQRFQIANSIIKNKCSSCHGPNKNYVQLVYDTAKEYYDSRFVTPGSIEKSPLLTRTKGANLNLGTENMPKGSVTPLNLEQIQAVKDWINQVPPFMSEITAKFSTSLNQTPKNILEGDSSYNILIEIPDPYDYDIKIYFNLNGTAELKKHYSIKSDVILIEAGSKIGRLELQLHNNDIYEGDKTIVIGLTQFKTDLYEQVSNESFTIAINDDETQNNENNYAKAKENLIKLSDDMTQIYNTLSITSSTHGQKLQLASNNTIESTKITNDSKDVTDVNTLNANIQNVTNIKIAVENDYSQYLGIEITLNTTLTNLDNMLSAAKGYSNILPEKLETFEYIQILSVYNNSKKILETIKSLKQEFVSNLQTISNNLFKLKGFKNNLSQNESYPSSLIAYFNFNNSNFMDGKIVEESKKEISLTLNDNATITMDGRFGQSLLLDGDKDYATTDEINTDHLEEFSVLAWIKPSQFGDARIVCKSPSTDRSQHIISLAIYDQGQIKIRVKTDGIDGSSGEYVSEKVLELNKWQQIGFSWSRSSGKLKIIYNGAILQSFDHGGDYLSKTNESLVIGNINHNDSRYFNGQIDEISLFNADISATNIPLVSNFNSMSVSNIPTEELPDTDNSGKVLNEDSMKFYTCDESSKSTLDRKVRRLKKEELINSYRYLFGQEIVDKYKVNIDEIPDPAYITEKDSDEFLFKADEFEKIIKVAETLSQEISFNTGLAANLADSNCLLEDQPSQTCYKLFIENFGEKVYRRPLLISEVTSILNSLDFNTYNTSVEEKFQVLDASKLDHIDNIALRLLLAPQFLLIYDELEDSKERDPYEIASYLSFTITMSPPDETLLNLAKSGQLNNLNVIQGQSLRLLQTPLGRKQIGKFVSDWLKVSHKGSIPGGTALIKDSNPFNLASKVQEHFEALAANLIVDNNANLSDLLSSNNIFINDEEIAKLYKVSWQGEKEYQLSNTRAGILGSPGFNMDLYTGTSIVTRGARVRQGILCDQIPAPSAEDLAGRDDFISPSRLTTNNREYWQLFTMDSNTNCINCHKLMNPIGNIFEGIDGIGRTRSLEEVYDGDGKAILGIHKVNSVETPRLNALDTVMANSPGELGFLLAQTNRSKSCLTKNIFEFQQKQKISKLNACIVNETASNIENKDLSIMEIMASLIADESILNKRTK